MNIVEKANQSGFHEVARPNLFFMNTEKLDVAKFGCYRITSNDLSKTDLLLYPEKFRIDRSYKDWSFLKQCKLPCNALILTDNYLLSNDETYENTLSVLYSLLPDDLAIDFDLTIIGYDPKKSFKRIRDQYDSLLTRLSNGFSYNINLSIIREEHHGRYIHTNYSRFWSDKGFGLFKTNKIQVSNETTIEFNSVAEFGKQTNCLDIRFKELEKCKNICQAERISENVAGNCKNRLLK